MIELLRYFGLPVGISSVSGRIDEIIVIASSMYEPFVGSEIVDGGLDWLLPEDFTSYSAGKFSTNIFELQIESERKMTEISTRDFFMEFLVSAC